MTSALQMDTTIEDDDPPAFDVVLPDPDEKIRAQGWRLHVYREAQGNTLIAHERVLPEKVADPKAYRVIESRRLMLHQDEIEWLFEQLRQIRRIAEGEPK